MSKSDGKILSAFERDFKGEFSRTLKDSWAERHITRGDPRREASRADSGEKRSNRILPNLARRAPAAEEPAMPQHFLYPRPARTELGRIVLSMSDMFLPVIGIPI